MRKLLLWLLISVGLLGRPAFGQHVGIYTDTYGGMSVVELGPPRMVTLYVLVTRVSSLAVWFKAPIPECWASATYLDESSPYDAVVGNAQDGVMIHFAACVEPPNHVLTINIWDDGTAPGTCCLYELIPHRQSPTGRVDYVDCQHVVYPTVPVPITIRGLDSVTELENVSPPDKATDQPRRTKLVWDSWSCSYYPRVHDVYFGTTDTPPIRTNNTPDTTYDPGPLTPNTTYYWRIVLRHLGAGGSIKSPLWSFTTWDASPARDGTWGAIKALYR